MDSRWRRAAKTNFFRFWHETVRCSEGRCLLLPDCFTRKHIRPLPLGVAPAESGVRACNSIGLNSQASSQTQHIVPSPASASATRLSSACGSSPATLMELCMSQLGYSNDNGPEDDTRSVEHIDWRRCPLLGEQFAELENAAACSCSCSGSRSLGARFELDAPSSSLPDAPYVADTWLLEDALGLTPRDTLVDAALGRVSRGSGAHFGAREALRVLQVLLVFHRAAASQHSDAQSKHLSSPAARNRRHLCAGNASLLAQQPTCFRCVVYCSVELHERFPLTTDKNFFSWNLYYRIMIT